MEPDGARERAYSGQWVLTTIKPIADPDVRSDSPDPWLADAGTLAEAYRILSRIRFATSGR